MITLNAYEKNLVHVMLQFFSTEYYHVLRQHYTPEEWQNVEATRDHLYNKLTVELKKIPKEVLEQIAILEYKIVRAKENRSKTIGRSKTGGPKKVQPEYWEQAIRDCNRQITALKKPYQ